MADRVVVERDTPADTTQSGLYLPPVAQEKPQEGTVLAVGPGKRDEKTGALQALDVQIGDRVLFGKYSGAELKVDGKHVIVMREDDILAVLG